MHRGLIKPLFVPGAVLLLATILLSIDSLPLSPALLNFYYFAAFSAGLLLAWRFHSTRVFFSLLAVLLAERALSFFSAAPPASPAPSRMALAAVSALLPLNFLGLALMKERGFTASPVGLRLFLIFVQSVFVALACRPDHASGPSLLTSEPLNPHWFWWTNLPQPALLILFVVAASLLTRFVISRKPVENGSFWALLGTALALQRGGLDRHATAYLGTAALVLTIAVVETSYLMAYHDELTGLPGRRAFNELLLGLEQQYAIAIVDVDHFKNFNDTYGHDTGDEVLRMVAGRLSGVSGGGRPFRCGGEEFAIVFPGKSVKDAQEPLELLRQTIQSSTFKVRGHLDRRKQARGPEDRRQNIRKPKKIVARPRDEVSVTVSIGVAEPSTKNHNAEKVISAADKALYLAKEGGRNRVALDGS